MPGVALPRNSRRVGGFTLIEMMIVLAVMTIVAAIAYAGVGRNTWQSDYRKYTDDLEGAIQRARNLAIDHQTEVWIDFQADTYRAFWTEPDPTSPNYGDPLELYGEDLNRFAGGRLASNNDVCIRGFSKGIQAPSQANMGAIPANCATATQTLRFFPSGEMRIEVPSEPAAQRDWGGSLYVANNSVAGQPSFTVVEIFPGGLIRKRDDVRP